MAEVHTIDLKFQGQPGAIAVYALAHAGGVALIESGPGSTLGALLDGLAALGFQPGDVTDVLLTHIHLDHGGAAGWWARQGARIHVHPNGAPHLVNPEKLLASAGRIYGDMMGPLWGEFLPVPEERLVTHQDGEEIWVGGVCALAVDTPGHAEHHFAYLVDGDLFTGDIGGVRVGGMKLVRLPTPPPEFHPVKWRESLHKLAALRPARMLPTHFGAYDDPQWQIEAALNELEKIESWMDEVMPTGPAVEKIHTGFSDWYARRLREDGLPDRLELTASLVNPAVMSADGITRYWRKFRTIL